MYAYIYIRAKGEGLVTRSVERALAHFVVQRYTVPLICAPLFSYPGQLYIYIYGSAVKRMLVEKMGEAYRRLEWRTVIPGAYDDDARG